MDQPDEVTPAGVADYALVSKTGSEHFTAAKINLIFARNRKVEMSRTGRKVWIFMLRRDRQRLYENNK